MRKKRRGEEPVSFQLAPMIDITFLLLVFFMVTTNISREQVRMDIDLPLASDAELPDDAGDREIVNVDGEGRIFIGGDRQVQRKELARHLRRRYELDPPLRLYVRADRATDARRIKDVLRLAAEAGALDIIFGTHREGTPQPDPK